MSESAEQFVRQAFEAFNRGAVVETGRVPDDLRELFVEEPVIVPMRAALEAVEYAGPSALDDFAAAARDSWVHLCVDIEDVREVEPDKVIVTGVLRAVGRETGAEVEAHVGWVVELEQGRVAVMRTFPSEAEARAAVTT